jgi:UDP-glucose 4-epimerase
VYANSNPADLHEDIDLNVSPGARLLTYSLSKLTNEVQGLAYARKYSLPIVIARLFNTVGPRQLGTYGFVLPRFVEQALSGQPITIFGDGTQTRSFCDVRDTVAILDALADTPKAHGEVVNVGNDRQIRIRQLAELIRQRR